MSKENWGSLMFFKKHKHHQDDRIESLIGGGTVVTGDICFSGGLRIDGKVVGNVSASDVKAGTLVASEKAHIEGKVVCTHLILNGEIVGPIEVSQYVELQPKARIRGDLSYKTLEMHPGAIVDGRLLYLGDVKPSED